MTSSEPHHVAAEPQLGNGRAAKHDLALELSDPEEESEKPRTLRAQQKADTRRRLLDAATEVFLETGPNTPLELVAERAGVSKATLFFHFGTRVELLDRLAGHLYRRVFPSAAGDEQRSDFATFVQAYLDRQEDPEARLVWQIGDLIGAERPERLDAGYWHLVQEIELRLTDAGLPKEAAQERALVAAPALMLVARRSSQGLATPDELCAFVEAVGRLSTR